MPDGLVLMILKSLTIMSRHNPVHFLFGRITKFIGGENIVKGANDPTGLTIGLLNEHLNKHSYIEVPKNNFFLEGLKIDVVTINALLMVYEGLSESHKKIFREMIKTSLNFAKVLVKVWTWITPAE